MRLFVAPGGRGFAVFNADHPDLVRFYDAQGKPIARHTREELLRPEERDWPREMCVCSNVVRPRFAREPAYSPDGWSFEFDADGTGRRIRFFLPAGAVVNEGFERGLAAFLSDQRDPSLARHLAALDDDDPAARDRAAREIASRGWAAVRPLEEFVASAPSVHARTIANRILAELAVWKRMSQSGLRDDLRFLSSLLRHADPAVRSAAWRRLSSRVRMP